MTRAEQIAAVLAEHPLLRWVETSNDDRWECSCGTVLNPYNEDASAADAEELWATHVAAAVDAAQKGERGGVDVDDSFHPIHECLERGCFAGDQS